MTDIVVIEEPVTQVVVSAPGPQGPIGELAVRYLGTWNASTNTPTLADGTGTSGDFYKVSVAASRNLGSGSQTFAVNDYVLYEGGVWSKISGPGLDPNSYGRRLALPGLLAPQLPMGASASNLSLTLTAGRSYWMRFVPSESFTATLIAFSVVTAGADDAIDVGICSATGYKLSSSGPTTGKMNSVGIKTVAIDQALVAGTPYYAVFSIVTPFGGTVPLIQGITSGSGVGYVADLFGTAIGTRLAGVATAYPIAAGPTVLTAISSVPVLAVRET